ncbi:HoxN/HupN/NixA family nickel/cobalt transporter [Sphingomonas glacialis]|nr:HoxN/HupN/NixA family nickel/cobalt transporter [Sphingomonas glacialis]
MNVGAWVWALLAFHGQPVLLGVAAVVYGLGLRHAVDADHIAAIDNVTRKLLQQGKRSTSIGLWFALGHSSVIMLSTAAVVAAAGGLSRIQAFREVGGLVSTSVSGLFLLLVAGMNLCILAATVRTLRRVRDGHEVTEAELDLLFAGAGLLSRVFRPLFRCVSRPWHMFLLGFLFGLSFDTATEVSLFSISATQAAHGVSFGSALVYPVLFAAGMSLLDTTDGVMMVGAYQWAVTNPLRKLYYNMTITLMSIGIALFIGSVQLGTLGVRLFGLSGPVADLVNILNGNLNYLGIAIVAIFALAWFASAMTFRLIKPDRSLRVA